MTLIGIGQKIKNIYTLVDSGEKPSLPSFCDDGKHDCGFKFNVYAYAGTDDLKNDKFSVLSMSQNWATAVVFTIQKMVGSSWTDQVAIMDNTYGEFYDQGAWPSKPYYAGILIYWKNVLALLGVGEYRIKTVETIPLGPNTTFSRASCLHEYGCAVENSVRLEWWNNKGIGDINNDRSILDFSDLNWYNQVRLPLSIFGYPTSTYETEEIQYDNGEWLDVVKTQEEKYQLITSALPAWLHGTIKTLACQANELLVTDYSPNNPQEIIQKQVKLTSEYSPRYTRGSKCAPVTLEFKPSFNNLEIYRCL